MNPPVTHVVIPIKRFARGKTRLSDRLDEAGRARLARGMFEHVLDVSLQSPRVAGALVLTDADEIAAYARARGCAVLADRPDQPETPERLAHVVDAGLAQLRARRIERALVLMADLPQVTSLDVDELLDVLSGFAVVLAPDRSGHCTNALALRLAATGSFQTRFGYPESLSLHLQEARALGLAASIHGNQRLALDVDLAADLALAEAGEPYNL